MNITVTRGRKLMARLFKGEDLLLALEKLCREQDIELGEVRAIGAVSKARVGYYHQAEQKYEFLELNRPLEIVSLVGNISLKDGRPMVHAHIVLADGKGAASGGHLAEGTIIFACEAVIQEYLAAEPLVRRLDKDTGLFLWAGVKSP